MERDGTPPEVDSHVELPGGSLFMRPGFFEFHVLTSKSSLTQRDLLTRGRWLKEMDEPL